MPNIEIHGYGIEESDLAHGKRKEIMNLFKPYDCAAEIVITICMDRTVNMEGKNQPFIRVVDTPRGIAEKVIHKLKTLKMDIEYLELKKFIPK